MFEGAPVRIGMFSSFVISLVGTIKGIVIIGNNLSGVSTCSSKVGLKALIGILVCEVNLLLSFIIFMIFYNDDSTYDANFSKSIVRMCSLLTVSTCTYASSVSCGLISGSMCIMDYKNEKLFPKMIIILMISGSIGVLGFIIGYMIKNLANNIGVNLS